MIKIYFFIPYDAKQKLLFHGTNDNNKKKLEAQCRVFNLISNQNENVLR